MSQNIACLTLVFLTQLFSDLDHGQPGHHVKKKCRHLIFSLHYSSYWHLCKIFGVLNWSSAKEIQKCAYYILRANFVLMLFSWWIFNHVLFLFIFSLLCRQARRKWSRRQNNSQTQSKTSLERWVLVKMRRTSAVLENTRDSSAELACPFVQRWWISST